ncbi:DNA-binding response regulator, NarL/FixJ family, contains REC and HTH domains [Pedobacter steynii]|uniref:DNA-binding response regulator, NarL/FixJ family, contains REC and HTH domains n=1 Tax=Pedobacter steynii TaxID=430522 RepID=A0A1H0JLE8_9SPHI|nr:response regulator [Pedobacter steynii]NQX43099.1 response regulator transcription factor [Pedobacter steynii]SDO44259.1 DNA-binding response regulator, NarL/FixJ family, contains REC and HTH domains [Pedobacter steynii]
MFKKVLIVEDQEMISMSLTRTVEQLGITEIAYTYYCDDALMFLRKAKESGNAFDLLITDLSFEPDHREQHLSGGVELIRAAKVFQPALKVLVFSVENRIAPVERLFTELGINAYVCKARHDAKNLKLAIEEISKGKRYMPPDLREVMRTKKAHHFTPLDIAIISQLSSGTFQKDIPAYLEANKITPSKLSSIEKRLRIMKDELGFSKNEQLVAHCKDNGLI